MSKKSEEFFRIMLELLPSTRSKYNESVEEYGERLDTIIIEDIFMPEILELLRKNENIKLLKRIFDYFEEVSNCDDEEFLNDFSVTTLEILGNDRTILETARSYMGDKTKQLQIEADRDLGRILT